MTTYLIVGATTLGQTVARQLAQQPDTTVRVLHATTETLTADVASLVTEFSGDLTAEATYVAPLQDNPIIFSALSGMDVDLAFEALFDAQYHQRLKLARFVMLSTAGVDQEVTGDLAYPGIDNVKEYLNQQRYAAKLVDEAEFPYTILRPVTLTDGAGRDPQIIKEGNPVPAGTVSHETVARVAVDLMRDGGYDYQSLAIC
ncbi:NAD(P)-binding oxidoreductase [Levilactobacillus wangkuiensis]|uniref:NAD(P)-binding oxidoreductase n=1 Tax=Levilactobacillus wangkuiensis TaxID=2799566 RepID=UPI00194518E7|nr:NAD(P)-binding oxidoreductase [Levilactobacillus wangkuiensis]